MATQIKLYVEPEKEIRVFTIEASATFASLQQRVRDLTSRDNFKLLWIDSEGDQVVCGSDDELKEARNTGKRPLRFVVAPAKVSSDKKVHAGVECDGCRGDIAGTRYKCLQCPNYDLCENCEKNQRHSEHAMIAIRNPENHGWKRVFGPRMGGGCPSFRRGPCGRPRGGPFAGQCPPPFAFLAPLLNGNAEMDIDTSKPFPEIIAEITQKLLEQFGAASDQGEKPDTAAEESATDATAQPTPTEAGPTVVRNVVETFVAETVDQRAPSPAPSETDAGWTKLQPEATQENAKTNSNGGDSKISAALRAMEEMGFPKESVLLQRLLQNYNGDISRVLDSLK